MSQLRLAVLGPPQIELAGSPVATDRRKAIALLVYLAITDEAHSRESLATMFWPDFDQSRALAYLRRAIWEVNNMLGKGWLAVDRERASVQPGADLWIDLVDFQERTASASGTEFSAVKLALVTEAVALYRGDFLSGFTLRDSPQFDDWQAFQTESLRRELADALSWLADGYGSRQEWGKAVAHAHHRLALDPLHEPAHRQLMRLLASMDDRTAALRQYEQCVQSLQEELGVQPEAETTALYEKILTGRWQKVEGRRPADPVSPNGSPDNHLPQPPTPFVGRQAELDDIGRLLQERDQRLITLVGPGGCGKSRLAIQAAIEQSAAFSGGLYFIPLAPLRSPEDILPALAKTLHFSFREEGNGPQQQLLNFLRQKKMLLIMDNYEHLLADGGETLPGAILAAAPEVKILITSRVRLNVQGESLYPVGGMRLPEEQTAVLWAAKTGEGLAKQIEPYSGIQLFLQSARRVRPHFELDESNFVHVLRICRLVEGMPLGIELAAAWLELLSPSEIATQIKHSLDFLETDAVDVPKRQRSIRAVFIHSWRLLNEAERDTYRRLSVFLGGFSHEAAQQVAGASLRSLLALTNKSLVHREAGDRFALHELLRQYAAERLAADITIWKEVRGHFSQYYSSFLSRHFEAMKGPEQKAAFDAVEAESDNVRAGWIMAVEEGLFADADRALEGLVYFYMARALRQDLAQLLDRALPLLEAAADREPPGTAIRIFLARLLAARSFAYSYDYVAQHPIESAQRAIELMRQLGVEEEMGVLFSFCALIVSWRIDYDEGIALLEEGVARLRQTGDRWSLAMGLQWLGECLWRDPSRQNEVLLEGVAIAREIGDRLLLGYNLSVLGDSLEGERKYDEAASIFQECVEIFESLDDLGDVATSLYRLGTNRDTAGDYNSALEHYVAAGEFSREIGNRLSEAEMLSWESIVARRTGDLPRARKTRLASQALYHEVRDLNGIAWSLFELGEIERVEGHLAGARALYEQALHLFRENQMARGISFYHLGLGEVALVEADFADARDHFEEAGRLAELETHEWAMAYAWNGLGRALTGLDEFEAAELRFRQALDAAHRWGVRGLVLAVIAGWAELGLARNENERAARLASLVLTHPATWQESRELAKRVLASTEEGLLPEVEGQATDLDGIVTALLAR